MPYPEADNTLSITVYRKSMHMDQYHQWDSHHHLSAKYSIINNLTYRAKTVCNKLEILQKEMDHLRKALSHCKHPKLAIDAMSTARTLLALSPPPLTSKPRATLPHLIPRAYVKASRRSTVSIAYRPTSRAI